MKRILIVAGPNGAGKTTFATQYLSREAGFPAFVNADLIATGLNPVGASFRDEIAGRLMLERIHDLAERGLSFAFETTLAGRAALRWIPPWREGGYQVNMLYLWLSSVELAVARVRTRVEQGGHMFRNRSFAVVFRGGGRTSASCTGRSWTSGPFTTTREDTPSWWNGEAVRPRQRERREPTRTRPLARRR